MSLSFLSHLFPRGKSEELDGHVSSLLRVVRVSWSLLTQREKRFFILRFFFRAVLNVIDMIAIGLMGLLGGVTATGLSGTTYEFLGFQLPSPTPSNVTLLVGSVATLIVLKGGLAILFDRWNAVFLAEIEIKNSVKLARYLFDGTLEKLRNHSRAEIAFLTGPGVSAAFSGVLGSVTAITLEISLFLSVFVLFVLVDWIAAIAILLFFLVLISVIQLTTVKRYLSAGRNTQKAKVDAGGAILEMVDAFREIAVLSKQDFFLSRYMEARKLDGRTAVTIQVLKSLPRYVAETGLILGAFGFVVWQLNRESLGESLFALGVFLAGSFRMMGAVIPIQQTWNELRFKQQWVSSVHSVLEQLRDQPEHLDASLYREKLIELVEETVEKVPTGLPIQLASVSFTHKEKQSLAVDSITATIDAGSFTALVGPSGAGKTTLVDLILGLYEPDEGTVLVNGISPREIRAKYPGLISYVPQKPGLVGGSISQNIALGLQPKDIDEEAVWNALEMAELADFVGSLPDGINSSLGKHADALSGGQIQRLGLARALYSNPNLIILDEATSALDAATEASVASSILNLGDETTVIVIAHRLSTIQHADVVHVMNDGKFIASGDFKEVRRRVPMIEEYVKLMSFDED